MPNKRPQQPLPHRYRQLEVKCSTMLSKTTQKTQVLELQLQISRLKKVQLWRSNHLRTKQLGKRHTSLRKRKRSQKKWPQKKEQPKQSSHQKGRQLTIHFQSLKSTGRSCQLQKGQKMPVKRNKKQLTPLMSHLMSSNFFERR